ncbi:hypothetical protein MTO96_015758 [Rhipicephalus appendiculatus]
MAARRRLSTTAPPAASTQSWHGTHGSTTPQPAAANPPRPRGPPHARASPLPPSHWTLSLAPHPGSVPSEMQEEHTRCHSQEVYVSPRGALEVGAPNVPDMLNDGNTSADFELGALASEKRPARLLAVIPENEFQ